MDMHKYISELLSEHDCVIIPGLGGFVGSYQPAQIHPVYHTFQPPSKKVLFNINLKQNDGLLANHIVQAQKISFQEAAEKVRVFAEETQRTLKARKYLILPAIGKLYVGKEGNVQFDQDLRTNHLPESYGLLPFFSAPVKAETIQEKPVRRVSPPKEFRELARKAIPKPLKWAAILAVPVSVAVLLSIAGYDSIKNGTWSTADVLSTLSPFTTNETREIKTIPEEELPVLPPEEIHQDPDTVLPPPAPTQNVITEEVPHGKFAVIIGAFRIDENARKLVNSVNRRGINAFILDQSPGGLSRVTAGVFTDGHEAAKCLNRIRDEGFPGAWLLEK
jgi:nucleoid DNA-binding protein